MYQSDIFNMSQTAYAYLHNNPQKDSIDYPKIYKIDEKSKEDFYSLFKMYAESYHRSENDYLRAKKWQDFYRNKYEGYDDYATNKGNEIYSCECGRVRGYDKYEKEMCHECHDRCVDCVGIINSDNKLTNCKECDKQICNKNHKLFGSSIETDCNCNGLCFVCCRSEHHCDTCSGHNGRGKHDKKITKMSFRYIGDYHESGKYCIKCLIKITNKTLKNKLPKDTIMFIIREYLNENTFEYSKKRKNEGELNENITKKQK